jgi:DNA-binding MarR family transcriptional regulator
MKSEKSENSDSLSEPRPNSRRLPPLLRRAWYNLNQAFRRRISHTGLTPDQYTILRLLSEGPPEGLTQRELCVRMCSDPNTMASLLSRMEKCGLLGRRTHEEDRRAHRVTILPDGVNYYRELFAIAMTLQDSIVSALPAKRREQFLSDLERIADACQQQVQAEPSRQKNVGKKRKNSSL